VTQLNQLLGAMSLPLDGSLYARRPWAATSEAVVGEPDTVPAGYAYLLEVDLVVEVLQTWSSWRGGQSPTPTEAAEAVIYYAEHDAYQPTS
jgi:hypothetical protein